jgi:hypothetical protein
MSGKLSPNAVLPGLLLALLIGACGGSEPPPKTPAARMTEEVPRSDEANMLADSEVGGMNAEKTQAVFNAAASDLKSCFIEGSRRVEFLSGRVHFAVEVDSSGRLSKAYLKDSTLGDRRTEQCMLEALESRKWPKPVGGRVGRADGDFQFDADSEVRLPVAWSVGDIKKGLAKLNKKLRACKSSNPSAIYRATLYVDTSGAVLSAGVATPDGEGATASDCVVDVLKQAMMSSPGSWPAKVTFDL